MIAIPLKRQTHSTLNLFFEKMRLRNRQRLRLPARLREEEEEGYFEDDGQGNEAEENEIPEIPDEIDLIELELPVVITTLSRSIEVWILLQHFSQCKGHVQH